MHYHKLEEHDGLKRQTILQTHIMKLFLIHTFKRTFYASHIVMYWLRQGGQIQS